MAYEKKTKRSANWNYGGERWRLSRSKIDLFTECERCFYLDNKIGVSRPRGPSFTLNLAVDALLKKEFDIHRAKATQHPLLKRYGVEAVPFQHKDIDLWRDNFQGLSFYHQPTGFTVSGAIDDLWVNPAKELIVVDYKATAKDGKMDALSDTKWEAQYKRQMEIYQWLLRNMGFKVSDTGYFVYVNGKKDREAFDGRLDFDITLIPHLGKTDWVDGILLKIKECLDSAELPKAGADCEFCPYREAVGLSIRELYKANEAKKAKVKEVGEGKTLF
ncbi:MAG: PD-(D/E)XK nuclease family protein [Candidatus Paceibacterota bacterium]